jgi:hypothetical protein
MGFMYLLEPDVFHFLQDDLRKRSGINGSGIAFTLEF